MNTQSVQQVPSYSQIIRKAWPIILANASVPLLGLVDTAVIGRTGSVAELGAIALGAIIFSFVYWGFGFLRMGTTGLVAQASGAGEQAEVRAVVLRALLCALGFGLLIVILQIPIAQSALWLLEGSEQVESTTNSYISLRIWGAPAALGLFALMGLLIGLNMSKTLLFVQLLLNGSNMALDVFFAAYLDLGAEGIAIGTAIAEWLSFSIALVVVAKILRRSQQSECDEQTHEQSVFFEWSRIFDKEKLKNMIAVNTDIMVRTLFLVFGFAWFANYGARFGDVQLAANHILLQFVSFSAFFLDGFAYVAESLVGRAKGAKNRRLFDVSVSKSTHLAAGSALFLALSVYLLGPFFIQLLTDANAVQQTSRDALWLAAIYIFLSFAAFQLDGIFIGTTRTRAMRNASAFSLFIFLLSSILLTPIYANDGLWFSFIIYVCARALFLLREYKALVVDAFKV
ncbi:MAG: MATE family efflux transporter [Pseudohongiellaceae bacterium]|nr:MATE family efflux transporter [Pseudohongiellaceae bacterium]